MKSEQDFLFSRGSMPVAWGVAVLCPVLDLLVSLFVGKLYLPVVLLAIAFTVTSVFGNRMEQSASGSNVLQVLTARITLVSALVMIAINMYLLKALPPEQVQAAGFNLRLPYVTVLVLTPVKALMTAITYFRVRRKATDRSQSYMGRLVATETVHQLRMVMYLTLIIAAFTWFYYLCNYSNINFNTTDRVWFVWIPIGVFAFSLLPMMRRYMKIYAFYRDTIVGTLTESSDMTVVRILIVCGDMIFLSSPDTDKKSLNVDTPARATMPYTRDFTCDRAVELFMSISGCRRDAFELKRLYENENSDTESNIFHYLCSPTAPAVINSSRLKGEWHTGAQLDALINAGIASPMLVDEFRRLRKIALARKTYYSDGRRRYPVKHYAPTFRLRELRTLDVDYSDPQWLSVSKVNEDSRFFHLRRFLRKHFRRYEM